MLLLALAFIPLGLLVWLRDDVCGEHSVSVCWLELKKSSLLAKPSFLVGSSLSVFVFHWIVIQCNFGFLARRAFCGLNAVCDLGNALLIFSKMVLSAHGQTREVTVNETQRSRFAMTRFERTIVELLEQEKALRDMQLDRFKEASIKKDEIARIAAAEIKSAFEIHLGKKDSFEGVAAENRCSAELSERLNRTCGASIHLALMNYGRRFATLSGLSLLEDFRRQRSTHPKTGVLHCVRGC